MASSSNYPLPAGFPRRIQGSLCWSGTDHQVTPEQYVQNLTHSDILEIEAAVKHFQSLGLARGLANPETFPLSENLAKRLRSITEVVYDGRGFLILRGIQPALYPEEERVIMYAGLTSYVANSRARNIDHIRDRTNANPANDVLKPLEQAVSMTFHTDIDVSDMLTMFTQSVPPEGGDQYIASIASIYNNLAIKDPEVIQTLAADWYWERSFRPAVGEEVIGVYTRPVIGFEKGNLQVNYAATFLGGNKKYPLSSNAPPLSKQQLHAMKALQEAAREVCVRLTPKAGDMLFMNNYGLMHARDTFVDSVADEQKKRYIMRLWLHDDHKGWESASALKRNLDQNFDLPPEKQGLMTGNEWDKLPRSWRVKSMGVSENDCHD